MPLFERGLKYRREQFIARSLETMPATMGETFVLLHKMDIINAATAQNLRKSIGFRNIAVHNDDEVAWNIVYAIATQQQQDFKHFARQIIRYTERSNP